MSCLMERLALHAGYCCIHEMLRSNRAVYSRIKLAEILGVNRSTIDYWESRVQDESLSPCRDCPPPLSDRKPFCSPARGGSTSP